MKFTDHPDDQAARIELTHQLASLRKCARLSREAVDIAAGLGTGRISLLERHPERISRFRTYTAYANTVGFHLDIDPIGDAYQDTPTPPVLLDRDDHHQYSVMQRIVETRHQTVKASLVAERMGIGEMTVFKLEQLDRDDPSVAVWQSYTRSIDGRLGIVLTPFEGAVAA